MKKTRSKKSRDTVPLRGVRAEQNGVTHEGNIEKGRRTRTKEL
jgi:hypothetical protein